MNDDLMYAASRASLDSALEEEADKSLPPRLNAVRTVLEEAMAEHDRFAAIYRRDYLPVARDAAIGEMRQRLQARIDDAANLLLAHLRNREQELRVRLAVQPIEGADATALVIEARGELRKLDALIREQVLFEAARTGDVNTVQAALMGTRCRRR